MSAPMDTSNDSSQSNNQSNSQTNQQSSSQPASQSNNQSASRERARVLFNQYVRQFTEGCGQPNCPTSNCASNPSFTLPSNNQPSAQPAAQLAIQTMKQSHDRQLCPNIQSDSQSNSQSSSQSTSSATQPLQTNIPSGSQSTSEVASQMSPNKRSRDQMTGETEKQPVNQSATQPKPIPQPVQKPVKHYRYQDFLDLYDSCKQAADQEINQSITQSDDQSTDQTIKQTAKSSGNPFARLVRLVGEVFADLPHLELMFRPTTQTVTSINQESTAESTESSNNQSINQTNNQSTNPSSSHPSFDQLFDWDEFERTMELLTREESVNNSLSNAVRRLLMNPQSFVQSVSQSTSQSSEQSASQSAEHSADPSINSARVLFMLFFSPVIEDLFDQNDNLRALSKLIHQTLGHSISQKIRPHMIEWLVDLSQTRFDRLLDCLQQYVTVKFLINQSLSEVQSAIQSINLLYQANKRRDNPIHWKQWQNDAINQSVNQSISLKEDYKKWKTSQMISQSSNPYVNQAAAQQFSLTGHAFILDAAAKSNLLKIDASYTMHHSMNQSINQSMLQSLNPRHLSPYLVLKVRRDHLIEDTLHQLQSVGQLNYQKPLKVQFANEQGIDEGGVKKEFFQLIVHQLFDPQYGMFTTNSDKSSSQSVNQTVNQSNNQSSESSVEELVAPLVGGACEPVASDAENSMVDVDASESTSTDAADAVAVDMVDEARHKIDHNPNQSISQSINQSNDHDHDQGTFLLFNPLSFESSREFELVGIVLGLALYNSVILDLKFPMYYYKKLLDNESSNRSNDEVANQSIKQLKDSLNDLSEFNPALAKGLQTLLEHDESIDIESIYQRTFTIDVDMYGTIESVDLMENGSNIPLTHSNRQQYVSLYVDYVLHRSINQQFSSFKRGFDRLVDRSILSLFEYEQLQLCIVGSSELDFAALQSTARYEGYEEDSEFVSNFWSIVHSFDDSMKKKLLSFCTGSDRVPIRGLGALRLTVAKNGDDSDLLPTASTCFNVLLMPEYKDQVKMERCLRLAINNGVGFGLI